MRARLQRGGTEPSVTPLSLSRVSSFSLAQGLRSRWYWAAELGRVAVAVMLMAAGARVNLASDVRRAAARSCRMRARSLSLALSLSLAALSLSRERERERRRRSRAARVSRRAILSTSDV